MAQLKELIKPLGLQLGGKRQDLIDRLEQHIRHCQVTGQNVRLLALRTIVLKMMTNDPIPNFDNLYNALQTGVIDHQLMAEQLARLQHLANKIRGKPRLSGVNMQSGHSLIPSGNASSQPQYMPYSPQYRGPGLLFPNSLFYQQQLMILRFPYVVPPSKGRNLCNISVRLQANEIALLQTNRRKRLYLFGGLQSEPNPSFADIQFPPIEIHVEGINTKQYVKGLKGKPGTCRPADLTDFVNPNRPFTINIVYSDAAEEYLLYLYIVDARSPEELVEFIKGKQHISQETTKVTIISDYQQNQDDDIVMDTSSLSLRCPLTYARLSTPIRSVECDHIQCFDCLSFLTMQERIPSWICPVCSKKINPANLAVSDYILDILRTTSDEVDTVNINTDGSWDPIDEENAKENDNDNPPNTAHQSREATSAPKVDDSIEIISLDSDSEDEQPDVTMRSATSEAIDQTSERSLFAQNGADNGVENEDANEQEDDEIDEATITELESAISQNVETIISSNPPSTGIAASPAESVTARRDSLSSDDRPIQAYSRRSRVIDLEDEEMEDVSEADIPTSRTPNGTTHSSDTDKISETNTSNEEGGTHNTVMPKANGQVIERLPTQASKSSAIAPRESVWRSNNIAQMPPPSTTPPTSARHLPPIETPISIISHSDASRRPSLNSTQGAIRSANSGINGSNSSQQSTEKAPEQRMADVSVAEAASSRNNPASAPIASGGNAPNVAVNSPKTSRLESLDIPKAKRLKIPTDPNFSIIENIARTVSRPASTDGTNHTSSQQPNAQTISGGAAVPQVGNVNSEPIVRTTQRPQEGTSSSALASIAAPELNSEENRAMNSIAFAVNAPPSNKAPGPQQSLPQSNDFLSSVEAMRTRHQPIVEVRSDSSNWSVSSGNQTEEQRKHKEPLGRQTDSTNQQRQPMPLAPKELQQRQQEAVRRQEDLERQEGLIRQEDLRRQQMQQVYQRQQDDLRKQQVQIRQQEALRRLQVIHNQQNQTPQTVNHQIPGHSYEGRMTLTQTQSQGQLSKESANTSNENLTKFRQLVLNSSALINQYKVSQGEGLLIGSSQNNFQTPGPGNRLPYSQTNGTSTGYTNGSANVRARSLPNVQALGYLNGKLMGQQDGQQKNAPLPLTEWTFKPYVPQPVNNQIVSANQPGSANNQFLPANVYPSSAIHQPGYENGTQRTTAEKSTMADALQGEGQSVVVLTSLFGNTASSSLSVAQTPMLEQARLPATELARPLATGLARRATTDGATLPTAARYSRSPFDILNENPFAEKVKGLLGIEVQPGLMMNDFARPSLGSPTNTQFGSKTTTPIPRSTPSTREPSKQPELLENGPQVDKSFSPLDNRIQDMAIATPASRRVSSEQLPPRTWNKRLGRKFNLSEINLSNIIELDDDS